MNKLFISYSSLDKEIARSIAVDLQANGFDVWLDEWKIKIGECIMRSVEKGIDEADFVILLLSKNSVKSGWVETEWRAAYWDQISDGHIKVLPVLIGNCERPSLVKTIKYADFRKDYRAGLGNLVSSIRSYVQSSDMASTIRLASERYKWRASETAAVFRYVMEREGLDHFSDYEKNGTIQDIQSAITGLGLAVSKAREITSEEYSQKLLPKVQSKIDEMLADLSVEYSDAYRCTMTSEILERIIDSVEEPFKSLLFALDHELDQNPDDWRSIADQALEYGVEIIEMILEVRDRYDFVSVEEEEVREWMVNLLYLIGGNLVRPTIPTLGLNPFSTLGLETVALQAHVDGKSELASIISRVIIYGIFFEEDFEKRLNIIRDYLDRMDWCDEDAQEEYLEFLKYALIEKKLDIPRKAVTKLIVEKAKSSELDEDVIEKLENIAEQLASQKL
ncbi:MAG: toll/interleukin-1 receptor domain-containing protein [Dehalococcoidia bacterium]